MPTFEFDYPRYLDAKETVDERALNERVTHRFVDGLVDFGDSALRVLEAGAGTGATLRRLLTRLGGREGPPVLQYWFVEERADNISAARSRLREWASGAGYDVDEAGSVLSLNGDGPSLLDDVQVEFIERDVFEYLDVAAPGPFDAIVAQALLDMVDLDSAIETMARHLRPGGLWYLPIHFDGVTALEPAVDPTLDAEIEEQYHQSMQDARAGRHLLVRLREAGARLLEVGASDWIVHGSDGEYPADEEYFLKCIVSFVTYEIESNGTMNEQKMTDWARQRHAQIRRGTLIYLAHQLDVCARMKQ